MLPLSETHNIYRPIVFLKNILLQSNEFKMITRFGDKLKTKLKKSLQLITRFADKLETKYIKSSNANKI